MKTYNVYNTENSPAIVHEYVIEQEFNNNGHLVTTIFRSHSESWDDKSKGEELISLIDTGNGFVFPKKEFAGDVGYDKFAELFILLSFLNKTERLHIYSGYLVEVKEEDKIII